MATKVQGRAEEQAPRAHDGHGPPGEAAGGPTDISAQGWRQTLSRTAASVKEDHVVLLSAGVAFFALLAIVPALAALVSIYGLVASPADITRHVDDLLGAAPTEVRELLTSQLRSITTADGAGWGAVVGLAVALWSASSGMKHAIEGANAAYDETESRSFLVLRGLALLFTLGAIVFVVVAIGVIAFLPAAVDATGLGSTARLAVNVARWPLLAVGLLVALAVFYRYAPNRAEPRWQWVSPGAVVATVLWLLASLAFSFYAGRFGSYNETYGSLGAVVVLMLWLLLTAFVLLLGAELNAEVERRRYPAGTDGADEHR